VKIINKAVSITIPAKPEYVGMVRLVMAALASLLNFDQESVEDIKTAISEGCTNAILQSQLSNKVESRQVRITSGIGNNKLIIDINYSSKESGEAWKGQLYERDLGLSIITSLMDRVEVIRESSEVVTLRLVKRLIKSEKSDK
jgi:serine/threonine-protein kinase RsbW